MDPSGDHQHLVQFYDSEDFLCERVADFLGAGLSLGEPVVVIATEARHELFQVNLQSMGFDLAPAIGKGQLRQLDAHQTLAKFMVGDMPDWQLFRETLGGAIDESKNGSRSGRIRAYGEMVDILWRAGNSQAAIRLEEMWNDLAQLCSFDLMCAYTMGPFYKAHDSTGFQQVCRLHSDVLPLENTGGGNGEEDVRALAAEIAHRIEIERALRRSLQDLRRSEERERLAHEAEKSARAKAEALVDDLTETVRVNELFNGVLAHDLRNPLGGIITAAQLAIMREQRDGADKLGKPLSMILASGHRMARMVDQLLDFSRIRLGKGVALEPKDLDLIPLLRQVMAELADVHPKRTMNLEQLGDTTGVWDEDRLCQVFSNLIGNALQHSAVDCGVGLRVDGRDPARVRIEVHNMGVIPAELVPRVFEPLVEGNRDHRRSRGLGLGLFITHQMVKAHGGEIELESTEATGTTFVVSLPRDPAAH